MTFSGKFMTFSNYNFLFLTVAILLHHRKFKNHNQHFLKYCAMILESMKV